MLKNDPEKILELLTDNSDFDAHIFLNKPVAQIHKFYLVGEMKQPAQYTKWFEAIRSAGSNDVVMLYINSPGGDLFTAIQFLRVIQETRATVVASAEGACMSAATIPFLAAKHWEISDHSVFMFHNYSTMTAGKGGEVYDTAMHGRRWSEKLLKDVYSHFLSKEEIAAILDNKDIWMSGEDVKKRLAERKADKDKLTKKSRVTKTSSTSTRKAS